MVEVLNKHHYRNKPLPENSVYVGRPTKWGNPFSHMSGTLAQWKASSREESVEKYREWILKNEELLANIGELRGKDLVCWCAPAKCHAEVLIELSLK